MNLFRVPIKMEEVRSPFPYLRFASLSRHGRLIHGVSIRGTNPGRNMSFSVSARHGDPGAARADFLGALGLPAEKLVVAGQVHGARVAVVDGEIQGAVDVRQRLLSGVDGLVTERPGLPLLVTAADCPPVFLFDPDRPAVGLVHSGWRGTRQKIVPAAVQTMREHFASDPSRLAAGIGPGIGPCCYAVGEDLAEKLEDKDREHLVRHPRGRGWVLDLPGWIFRQLREAGVPEGSIETAGRCTACDLERFFSHRAEKGDTGRVAAVAALRGHP